MIRLITAVTLATGSLASPSMRSMAAPDAVPAAGSTRLANPVVAAAVQTAPSQAARPADFVPADVMIAITLRDGDRQVGALAGTLERLRFAESPVYAAMMANPGLRHARLHLLGLASQIGADPWTCVGALLGREAVAGITADGGFVLAGASRDPALLDRVERTVHEALGLAVNEGVDEQRSSIVNGTRVYELGGQLVQMRCRGVLVLSNRRAIIEQVLGARGAHDRLAEAAWYVQAAAGVPQEAAVWATAPAEPLLMAMRHGEPLPQQMNEAFAGILFGGWLHALRHADQITAWAIPAGDALTVHARSTPAAGAAPVPDAYTRDGARNRRSAAAPLLVPESLGAVRIDRGWAELFSRREELLTPEAVAEFNAFTGTLSTLLGNVDFVEEVMANVAGPVQLFAARQDFEGRPRMPTPRLPAFALVIPLNVPPDSALRRRLDSAALTAASIINAEQSRTGDGYLVDLEHYRQQRVITMSLPPERDAPEAMDGEAASGPVRYNFEPAASFVSDRYVVATSAPLMHAAIDAVLDASLQEHPEAGDHVRIDLAALLAVLHDNEDSLVTNRMLDEDEPKQQATTHVQALLGALSFFESASLHLSHPQPAPSVQSGAAGEATLRLALKPHDLAGEER